MTQRKGTTSRTPRATRMTTPGYGFEAGKSPPGKKMPWRHVERLLTKARNYWVCTTRADGRPHAAPVWGVWLDGVLWFSTGQTSVKGRNLARSSEVVVHPEVDNEAVVVEGVAEFVTSKRRLKPVYTAYTKKYAWEMEGYPMYVVRPRVVFSFKEDLAETATRWVFSKTQRHPAS